MPTHLWLIVPAFLASGLLAQAVTAQDRDCTASLGSVEVRGNLNIAVRCQLTGTEINGNVTLFEGGSLIARNARIGGNLEARRADFVDIDRSAIDGNVRLEELVGDSSTIQQTDIGGNTTLSNNRSQLRILNNDLGGNLKATRNRGGLTISGNGIEGNLDCTGNSPEPTGFGNRVDGDTKGQCRNLGIEVEGEQPDDEPVDEPEDEAEDDEVTPPRSPPPPTTARPPTPSPTTSSPSAPPPAPSQPPATPATPTTTAPPTTSAPPAVTPSSPPAAPPAVAAAAADTDDDGGAGAFGWPVALLLPLLAWRRFAGRRTKI